MRIIATAAVLLLLALTPPHSAAASLSGDGGYGLADPQAGQLAATAQNYPSAEPTFQEAPRKRRERERGRVIPPSVALQVALSYSPGSQGLGVSLLRGPRLMYSVKLKTGNQIHRVLVDAQTAQVVSQ